MILADGRVLGHGVERELLAVCSAAFALERHASPRVLEVMPNSRRCDPVVQRHNQRTTLLALDVDPGPASVVALSHGAHTVSTVSREA